MEWHNDFVNHGYDLMKQVKPFHFKSPRKHREHLPIPDVAQPVDDVAAYSGQIDGMKAAKGEENFLKGAFKTGLVGQYSFRVAVGAPRNMPGYKELDFLLQTKAGEYVAVQIRDYDFIHHGIVATAKDQASDAFIIQELGKQGINVRMNKIYSVSDDDLTTIEDARKKAEEVLG